MVEKIRRLIKDGENIHVEFKLATDILPKNLFEIVCAFLNREGGTIILGVDDNKKIIGVNEEKIEQLKRDFANLCNNSEKITPTVHLSMQEVKINGKKLLYIEVPESEEVHYSNRKIFDRDEDGDYDVTGNVSIIADMYMRKKKINIENKVYSWVTIDDLRVDLIEKARRLAGSKNK